MNQKAFRLGLLCGFGLMLTSAYTNCGSQGNYVNPAQQTTTQSAVAPTAPTVVRLTLSQTSPSVPMGESTQISASGGSGVYTYSIAQANIATVSAEGVITGVAQGSALLTVTDSNNDTGTATVTITAPLVLPVYVAHNQLVGYSTTSTSSIPPGTAPGSVPGEHYYTLAELSGATLPVDYKDEGVSFYVYKDNLPGTIPLYYCILTGSNPYHYFSTNQNCVYAANVSNSNPQAFTGNLVQEFGYIYPASEQTVAGTQTLYQRLDTADLDEYITTTATSTQPYNAFYNPGTLLGYNPVTPSSTSSSTTTSASSGQAPPTTN